MNGLSVVPSPHLWLYHHWKPNRYWYIVLNEHDRVVGSTMCPPMALPSLETKPILIYPFKLNMNGSSVVPSSHLWHYHHWKPNRYWYIVLNETWSGRWWYQVPTYGFTITENQTDIDISFETNMNGSSVVPSAHLWLYHHWKTNRYWYIVLNETLTSRQWYQVPTYGFTITENQTDNALSNIAFVRRHCLLY